MARRTLILGAAGRDFHDFNVAFRDDPHTIVVGFTATQIPDIAGRRYPPELAGPRYPEGIPIYEESELEDLIRRLDVDRVVFAYSDVPHEHVMHLASRALARGADFELLGPRSTALSSKRPVVAVCAVRTGCGKSPATREISGALADAGYRVAVVRHPMPYGDLARQRVQRFATVADMDAANCTIEEREEYEPLVSAGRVVFAGVDYAAILEAAEAEADIVLWDGGNNDLPFYKPTVHVTIVDPHRAGHESLYHPGEANFLAADLLAISKVGSAPRESLERLRTTIRARRPDTPVVEGDLEISLDAPLPIQGRRVLCIEDGPTTSHGGMGYGAAVVLAKRMGAIPVDPRPFAVGTIAEVFNHFRHLTDCLPAMGYSGAQIEDLATTIAQTPCEFVLVGTPIDLRHLVKIERPAARVLYSWKDVAAPGLAASVLDQLARRGALAPAEPDLRARPARRLTRTGP